jgi:hypothetical protein
VAESVLYLSTFDCPLISNERPVISAGCAILGLCRVELSQTTGRNPPCQWHVHLISAISYLSIKTLLVFRHHHVQQIFITDRFILLPNTSQV